ncbi:MAG: helix-turn-helix domain-containing protein [Muricoprocola sp.]
MSAYTYEMVKENSRLPVRFEYVQAPALTILAHWHEYLEILMIDSGNMTAVIQAETYELSAGDILIINSKDIHMTQTHGDTTSYILLQISARYLQQYFSNFDVLRFGTWIPAGTTSEDSSCTPSHYLMEMLEIYQKEEDGYPLLFTARLHELLYCLYKYDSCWLAPDGSKAVHRDILRVTQTMDWVGEHYREALTLDEAAGNLGLSREYFCRIFRKYTGQTFLEYLNAVRVMRFHDELIYSNDSITNLMAAHGISNYKIFLRTFKKIYGDTPQKMRK